MGDTAFIKMHGLGNDFVILDGRQNRVSLGPTEARAVADRHTGIGCDQLITLLPSDKADLFMRIQNADGGEVAACGNATRCAAALLFAENQTNTATIETNAGLLQAEAAPDGQISIDMGTPTFGWADTPLAKLLDDLRVNIAFGLPKRDALGDPEAVDVGNPHAVFFVDDVQAIDLGEIGPPIEHHSLFPDRANVSVARINDGGSISLRTWERGVGHTLACGTAACATLVCAVRRGLSDRRATVEMDGGSLDIEWRADDHIIMTGPASIAFHGNIDLESLTGETAQS